MTLRWTRAPSRVRSTGASPRFTEFPQAVLNHKAELEGKTVVSFCTGGIRCEKAAILMQGLGLNHVYQLEGGILKYFEETDGFTLPRQLFRV
jgi:predicted sulfurtransferase